VLSPQPEYLNMTMDPGDLAPRVVRRLDTWRDERVAERLWAKDWTLWSRTELPELADRLGWLDLPETMTARVPELGSFAEEVRSAGYERVVLLGMGGSSLAAEVYQAVLGADAAAQHGPPSPRLVVLDSTHPRAVADLAGCVDLATTLFVVASKSGSTIETLSLLRYFYQEVAGRTKSPGDRFVAITDPGSSLEELAQRRRFRRVFLAPPDVGGRYSALSPFGLVPAALLGADLDGLLARARQATELRAPAPDNGAVALGALLGEAALAGRDKLVFAPSPSLAALPAWIEQLVAESTGKSGRGIVPVVTDGDDLAGHPEDQLRVELVMAGESPPPRDEEPVPTVRLTMDDRLDLGREMLRWEIATALAGMVLEVHPFDQPDVELAKEMARQVMGQSPGASRRAPEPDAPDEIVWDDRPGHAAATTFGHRLDALCRDVTSDDDIRPYLAVQAFLPPGLEVGEALEALRRALGLRTGLATTAGFGPRFLHSTGQLHKGGSQRAVFVQIVDASGEEPGDDLPIPGAGSTFGRLIHAQALGDHRALVRQGRQVVRIHLGSADDPARTAERLHQLRRAVAGDA
jgi:transaldolase/glucose-6-phosphate isomerase